MYLSYEKYQEMGGVLDESTFSNLNYEAQSYVDYVTFNRLENDEEIPEKVLQCIYYLIKILYNKALAMGTGGEAEGSETSMGAQVSSMSNDGVSTSFNVLSASEVVQSAESEMQKAIQRYLQGVRNNLGRVLLYRGFYPGE